MERAMLMYPQEQDIVYKRQYMEDFSILNESSVVEEFYLNKLKKDTVIPDNILLHTVHLMNPETGTGRFFGPINLYQDAQALDLAAGVSKSQSSLVGSTITDMVRSLFLYVPGQFFREELYGMDYETISGFMRAADISLKRTDVEGDNLIRKRIAVLDSGEEKKIYFPTEALIKQIMIV